MTAPSQQATNQLLLPPATRVTCPKCEHEFSLQEGFAKKALESLEESSQGALAAVREAERTEADRRARSLAADRERAADDAKCPVTSVGAGRDR